MGKIVDRTAVLKKILYFDRKREKFLFTLPEGCAKVLRTVPPALCFAELHRPGTQSCGEEFRKVESHYAS